ncbi:MAG: hypothetical protein GC160_07210 [Acidobacteria bacterium]|nr:hypothetical protein [Acidobacteriota bacterium]
MTSPAQTVILGVAGTLLLAASMSGQQQPIPYSHKTHLALGLQCANCHANADPGEFMGFPAEGFCMSCHQAIKTDSPHIQKLAAAAEQKQPIPWQRLYELPGFVYFSHRVHTQADVACETCHGPVRERDVMTAEVEHSMKSCMACHEQRQAPNECGTCHEEQF